MYTFDFNHHLNAILCARCLQSVTCVWRCRRRAISTCSSLTPTPRSSSALEWQKPNSSSSWKRRYKSISPISSYRCVRAFASVRQSDNQIVMYPLCLGWYLNSSWYHVVCVFVVFQLAKRSVAVAEPVNVDISFENPLECKLTNVVIRLEGPGIQKDMRIAVGSVQAVVSTLLSV